MRRFGAIALMSTMPALSQEPASRGVNWFSLEKESALGRGLAGDFRRQSPPVEDEVLTSYLSAIAARLDRFAQNPFPLSIEVSANADVKLEPGALPGGFMFVPLGLLLAVRDEAELAGPVAHALAHIAARHGTRQATRGQIVNLTTIPLIFIGGWGNDQRLIPLGFRKFYLENEADADRLASQWMAQAGYAPAAFGAYLERVQPTSALPIAGRAAALASAEPPARPAETGDFAAMQERARAHAPPPPAAEPKPKPPTLRRKP